jgi:hypothetical protein
MIVSRYCVNKNDYRIRFLQVITESKFDIIKLFLLLSIFATFIGQRFNQILVFLLETMQLLLVRYDLFVVGILTL